MTTDPNNITGVAIIKAALRHYAVAIEEFQGKTRAPHVVACREACAYLIYEHTDMSYPRVARMLGKAGHAATITAAKRFGARLTDNDPAIRDRTNRDMKAILDTARTTFAPKQVSPG